MLLNVTPPEKMKTLKEISFVEPDKCHLFLTSLEGETLSTDAWLEHHPVGSDRTWAVIRFSSPEEFERLGPVVTTYPQPIYAVIGSFMRAVIAQKEYRDRYCLQRLSSIPDRRHLIEFVDDRGDIVPKTLDASKPKLASSAVAEIVGVDPGDLATRPSVIPARTQQVIRTIAYFHHAVVHPFDSPGGFSSLELNEFFA
jgi:hypothetical protein